MNIPKTIKFGDLQTKGNFDGEPYEVYYDDQASKICDTNQYSVFSNKGFHGWLSHGFSMPELISVLGWEATDYETELKNFEL